MYKDRLLTRSVLQFAPQSDTEKVLVELQGVLPTHFIYYSELVDKLLVEHGKTAKHWRTKLSQLWPEDKLESTNSKCSKWVRLRTGTGYIIFTRKEDYETL